MKRIYLVIAIIFTLFIGCTKHSITNQISDSNSPIGGKKPTQ